MSTDTMTRNDLEQEISEIFDSLWAVIVHNDDVTSFATVIEALKTLFRHPHAEAERLAWVVHEKGQAVVAVLSEEEAKTGVDGLHGFGVQASTRRA